MKYFLWTCIAVFALLNTVTEPMEQNTVTKNIKRKRIVPISTNRAIALDSLNKSHNNIPDKKEENVQTSTVVASTNSDTLQTTMSIQKDAITPLDSLTQLQNNITDKKEENVQTPTIVASTNNDVLQTTMSTPKDESASRVETVADQEDNIALLPLEVPIVSEINCKNTNDTLLPLIISSPAITSDQTDVQSNVLPVVESQLITSTQEATNQQSIIGTLSVDCVINSELSDNIIVTPEKTFIEQEKLLSNDTYKEHIQDEQAIASLYSVRMEQSTTDQKIIDNLSISCQEFKGAQLENAYEQNTSLSTSTPIVSSVNDISVAGDNDISIVGLGFWTGLWDKYDIVSNLRSELILKKFNSKHPSNVARVCSALRKSAIKNDIDSVTFILSELANIKYSIENSLCMQATYKLLREKQKSSETFARNNINDIITKNAAGLEPDIQKFNSLTVEAIKNIFQKIAYGRKVLAESIEKNQAIVNKIKQSRLNAIACNEKAHQNYDSGYNSDIEKPTVNNYDQDTFLKRADVNLFDKVQKMHKHFELLENKLTTEQTELELLKFKQ